MSTTLSGAIDQYLTFLRVERGLSAATIRAYATDLKAFARDAAASGDEWQSSSQPTNWRPLHDLGHQINYPDYGNDRSEVGGWGGVSLGFRPYRPY